MTGGAARAYNYTHISFSLLAFACFSPFFLLLLARGGGDGCEGGWAVTHLPGFDGPLPFELETGYVEVDEEEGGNMFYYFVKSEGDPKKDPVIVWLTGGPGCSALSGLLFEIGPLTFDASRYEGGLPALFRRDHSWTKVASIIFIDSPIGTGFSYSRAPKYKTGDFKTMRQLYIFMKKWFSQHREFISNPLYIGGDSYSGKVLPGFVQEILNGNRASNDVFNLKGYFLGNPVTNKYYEDNGLIPFSHGMGLISEEIYQSTKEVCHGEYAIPMNENCYKHISALKEVISGINTAHILEPLCPLAMPRRRHYTVYRELNMYTKGFLAQRSRFPHSCRSSTYQLSYIWANNDMVQAALNIRKGTMTSWKRCNYDLSYATEVNSSISYHLNLTSNGCRALIYSGDHDAIVTFVGTQEWIKSLGFPIVNDWKPWIIDGQVGGFSRTYSNNLTFATIKGGGHTAPEYRPKECLAMIQRWILNYSL